MSPMPLHQALVVCDQVSPLPSVAHEALLTLRRELLPHVSYDRFVADYWRGRRREEAQLGEDYAEDLRDRFIMYAEDLRDRFIMTVGLAGEVGEVCELLKKDVRDGHLDKRELAMELGDVLYYLTKIAQSHGLSLADLKRINRQKLEARRVGGKGAFGAANVILEQPRTDWARVVATAPPNVIKDLRRAASFIDGTDPEANVVDEAEADRLAQVLRALAQAGEGVGRG